MSGKLFIARFLNIHRSGVLTALAWHASSSFCPNHRHTDTDAHSHCLRLETYDDVTDLGSDELSNFPVSADYGSNVLGVFLFFFFFFFFFLTVLQSNIRFSQFETPVDNDLVNAVRFSQSVRQTVNTKGV